MEPEQEQEEGNAEGPTPGPEPQPQPQAEPGAEPTAAPGVNAGPRLMPALKASALVIIVVFVAAMGSAIATCAYHLVHPPETPSTTTIIRPTPDVIVAVRDLARLETTSYHVERVIDLTDRQQRFFGLVTAEDAILLVAAGDVSAGVDLTKMRDGDVVADVEHKTARIVLPPPEILSTRLDNERTYVHLRHTDVLAKRQEDLETRARREAESTLRDSAEEAGIMDRAKQNAERTIRTLVRSLGYDEVRIEWRSE